MPVADYRPQCAFNLSVNFEAKVPTITASLKTIVYAIPFMVISRHRTKSETITEMQWSLFQKQGKSMRKSAWDKSPPVLE